MKSSHRLVCSALVACGALLAAGNAGAREPETPTATLSEIDAAALIEAAGGGYSIDEESGHVVNVGMGRRLLEPLLDELAVLQNLRTLALADTTLTNDLVKRLPPLPQLEALILEGCGRRITDAAF